MNKLSKKVVVIGIGNIFRSDDGVGPYIIDKLKEANISKNVELKNLESATIDILNVIEGAFTVIVIDSIECSTKIGKIHELQLDDLPERERSFNLHNIGLKSIFLTAKKLERLPQNLLIYGIEIKDVSYNNQLSSEVKTAADKLVKKLEEEFTQKVKKKL